MHSRTGWTGRTAVLVVALLCLLPAALVGVGRASVAARGGVGVSSFRPSAGLVGAVVTIKGKGFTGATAVAFAGVNASVFTVDSDKQITATVPAGATSGPVSVTSPAAPAPSRKAFSVQTKVSLSACSAGGGNRNVPAGTYPLFQVGWDMANSSYLKPFLKSTKTTVALDGGRAKGAGKYWDRKGVDDGFGGWRTDWTHAPGILLTSPGDTTTAEIHQLVTRSFSDGTTTYSPGTDLWAGLGVCTVHAV